MPHSNDRTIVTCAGDHQVRIFDIERTSRSSRPGVTNSGTPDRKVFKSHKSSVKRIVTEASPFYFLTCSEDGEVRQWDIRQPESAYPSHKHANIPPLISYSKHDIQLFTLSCSPSQPHYIALGGTHLHCFLHDRRMLGRDRLEERGQNGFSPSSSRNDDTISDSTRCVAKFAPHGQPRMTNTESRYITGCKLGTANPNELIVSWSVDLVYRFNILKDQQNSTMNQYGLDVQEDEASQAQTRKRKRTPATNSPSTGSNTRRRERRADDDDSYFVMSIGSNDPVSVPIPLRDLPFTFPREQVEDGGSDDEASTSHAQRVRTMKNSLSKSHFDHSPTRQYEEARNILKSSLIAFEQIDDYVSHRTYPMTDNSSLVDYELKLRNDRAKVWRYAQASGTLARVLMQVGFPGRSMDTKFRQSLRYFDTIRPAPREGSSPLERHEQFGYDFIKAVLLWLDSGVGAVLREFSPESEYVSAGSRRRFPVSRNASVDAIEKQLIPYLEGLATDMPIVYAGHGGAGDDPRQTDDLFRSEKEAVRALAREMKKTWSDLNGRDGEDDDTASKDTERRREALKLWAWKICFAILENAAIDVNYPFVEAAFGESTPGRRRDTSRPAAVNIDGTGMYCSHTLTC
jgi:nuclear receptor interaction protein